MKASKIEIDLSGVSTSIALHKLLSCKLGFPSFYGNNWDAFWDAITGLVELPSVIEFRHWPEFCVKFPDDADQLKKCFYDLKTQFPEFSPDVFFQ
ncbi:MAG: barstar family protein [Bdellovibrionaceae bacterium]|nr:barstar family protein [Pseudobdellovibrionaceae bacterium]